MFPTPFGDGQDEISSRGVRAAFPVGGGDDFDVGPVDLVVVNNADWMTAAVWVRYNLPLISAFEAPRTISCFPTCR
jgi:hypothetical protein